MTAPEIRKLAEDLLKKQRGPWVNYGEVFLGIEYDSIEDAEAEARRLNAMPGLLRAWFLNSFNWIHQSEHASLRTLIARCEAHQKGEAHE